MSGWGSYVDGALCPAGGLMLIRLCVWLGVFCCLCFVSGNVVHVVCLAGGLMFFLFFFLSFFYI